MHMRETKTALLSFFNAPNMKWTSLQFRESCLRIVFVVNTDLSHALGTARHPQHKRERQYRRQGVSGELQLSTP